jgi:hypothetical protein
MPGFAAFHIGIRTEAVVTDTIDEDVDGISE